MRLAAQLGKLNVRSGTIACAWLGQAGYLMKTHRGLTVMIDPYFSDECERLEGLKRTFAPPVTAEEFQPDILLVTSPPSERLLRPVAPRFSLRPRVSDERHNLDGHDRNFGR